ncbi:hypothetical protein [Alteromonas sp. RKMC-009]|uniref:hypothetical protein n=1 Tax=Alteromonas sp. RKMC-009 TaxID=2267264 RepID=UPI000E69E220|nr:hypothetical protein [Alteromonas sp. RKMC-009]AYA64320.1 hypothetical protein DS731_10095 [Alteromonas sp. RKMC-009]
MNWTDIKNLVGQTAPYLGTLLGGPTGTVIGSLIAKELDVENTPQAVQTALLSPENQIKIAEFESKERVRLKEIELAVLQDINKDRQDARNLHKDSKMPAIITTTLTLISTFYLAGLFFIEIPDVNKTLVNYFAGQLVALWVASVVYWVGTTRSSSDKNKLLSIK